MRSLQYVAKRSVIPHIKLWTVLLFWLVIPLFILIADIIIVKCDTLEFHENKIITKTGVFNKHQTQSLFAGVYSVTVYQSFLGRIFNYGDIKIDCPGKWDVDTTGIKNPHGLRRYLEKRLASTELNNIIYE